MSDFPRHLYPWQLGEWQQLAQLIAARKLPHALMLAGPRGIGKRHFAEALAQLLLCQAPREGGACGQCRGCELNKAATHPDLLWLEPEEAGKAIKVDQVRELTDALGKTAQLSGYKVVVLEPAEAMNTNAANALLKSLEEPAANTLLILVSHTPSAVLPTIRSRCQLRAMAMPRQEQVVRWLSPLLVGRDIPADELLSAARGAPLIALSLLEGDALEQREQQLQQLTRMSLGQLSAIELAANWHTGDAPGLMEWFLGFLHTLARWRAGVDDPQAQRWPTELRERLQGVELSLLHRYLEKVLHAKRLLLSGANPNKQLLWEELLLDWGVVLRPPRRRAG
ncbi:DNA polymerase III subunit delta' [Cellvibrio japonicus]|uniref:DNA polymerase III subunit delta' n=1 Tax=Cellvibrio japonicus (strain Ueda107) TaxID=498211 RepID=B3PHI9_CELJU|nr:DNA polymerase III subunit delta' [Cellvibrio japonicus]ACE84586.1 DNA polymerase III, delta prime subunit [Cellvibrio japonicus Ueda107]QEI12467.1 DNA polymerase III subunit delta' [Cellvibrio japonicus]QEI16041.1 DNA polymerase III subunit delta' [Cellvibrio japonicus]QEI19619.1 DNA polymerase III subunit delta' [Cellvibrio japonicus]